MLHASHNLFVQAIFTPLTRNTGKTSWFIDEFGAVLPLVIIGFAIYYWRRRRELPNFSETTLPGIAIGSASAAASLSD